MHSHKKMKAFIMESASHASLELSLQRYYVDFIVNSAVILQNK